MKSKLSIIIILSILIGLNFYISQSSPDKYTQAKIKYSSLIGSTSYLGRLDFWHLLVQNNDWENASLLEAGLNQDQVSSYKVAHQPQEIQKRITRLENNSDKNADDFIELAKSQTLLGLNDQAVNSIKKAHQLDLVRSDIDRLFYSISQ